MKAAVTVIFPIRVIIDVDENKLDDDKYVEERQATACDQAIRMLQSTTPRPVIHESDIEELID